MNGSLQIATAFGIPIRLHWSFLPFLFLFAASVSPALAVPLVIGLFGCVVLHELGHSLVARHFGLEVVDITLWPLGGMARMTVIPEVPKVEFWVAIAGPLVNVGLAALGFAVAFLGQAASSGFVAELAGGFAVINLLLGLFNLLPAFPMDGGRVLRAWLARRRDWLTATEQAVRTGRWVAFGMVALALLGSGSRYLAGLGCVLPLIALFIWFFGGRELLSVRLRHGVSPFGAAGPAAAAFDGVRSEAWDGEAPPPPPPASKPVASPEVGHTGVARRPSVWDPAVEPAGGFDEGKLRELERFHGRLRPPQD